LNLFKSEKLSGNNKPFIERYTLTNKHYRT
jgi:hypothetical protein